MKYWSQFDNVEIEEMHGQLHACNDDTDLDYEKDDTDSEQEEFITSTDLCGVSEWGYL